MSSLIRFSSAPRRQFQKAAKTPLQALKGDAKSPQATFAATVLEGQIANSNVVYSVGGVNASLDSGNVGFEAAGFQGQASAFQDTLTLSAQALAISGQATAKAEDGSYRLGLGASATVWGGSAALRLGSEKDNLRTSMGAGLGVGAGFDVEVKKNDDGTRTVAADLGISLLGKLRVTGQMTTVKPHQLKAMQRAYEASGLSDAAAP